MRRWLSLIFCFTGCAGATRAPADTHLLAVPTEVCEPATPTGVRATFRGGFVLTWPGWSGFGGWSDARVTADGGELLAVSDDGHYLQARLTHEAGRLSAVSDAGSGALPHCPNKRTCDVESLTLRGDGSSWVGVEREPGVDHQIWAFASTQPPLQTRLAPIALPPGLDVLPANAGLEAMTTLTDDSVLAIAEGPEPVPTTLPMWRWIDQAWQSMRYPTLPDFRPVAAAALPAGHPLGDALVLERKWLADKHEAGTRIVALRLPTNGATAQVHEVLNLNPAHCKLDNFEALATRVENGRLWLYLLSDDNLSTRQQTLLYAFTLE